MTLEQALFDMELVGHDFYLFVEKDDGTPERRLPPPRLRLRRGAAADRRFAAALTGQARATAELLACVRSCQP